MLKQESGNQSGEETEWGRYRKWKDNLGKLERKRLIGKSRVLKPES